MDLKNLQEKHQKVLDDSSKSYRKVVAEESIQVNKYGQKKFEIKGQYPNIIVKFPSGEVVLEEIETDSTVTEENLEKWKIYAGLGYEFKLIVPLSELEKAKTLTSEVQGINVQAYEITAGQVSWFGQ